MDKVNFEVHADIVVPVDPMDLLQCDSCQRVDTRNGRIQWDFAM